MLGVFAVVALLAGALAHARLTRLVTADRITQPARGALVRRYGASHPLSYLLHCRWCTGLWLAAPVAALVTALTGFPHPAATGVLLALAYSHITPLLATLEDED